MLGMKRLLRNRETPHGEYQGFAIVSAFESLTKGSPNDAELI